MADGLKHRIRVSTTLPPSKYERIKDYSDETSIPISRIFEKATDLFLEYIETNNPDKLNNSVK